MTITRRPPSVPPQAGGEGERKNARGRAGTARAQPDAGRNASCGAALSRVEYDPLTGERAPRSQAAKNRSGLAAPRRGERAPDIALEGAAAGRPADIAALEAAGGPWTIHIIPQAHIDLAWMWTREDGERMVLETFRRHAEVLEKNPTYTYAQSQLAAYRVVERRDPELFSRIERLIRKGQWEVVGGQWVEADNAMPSGESHIRQLVLGQRYAREKLGRACRTAWCPDGFTEQPASWVDLLSQAGMKSIFLKRPRERFFALPAAPFLWESPSGARIVAIRTNNKGYGWPLLSEGATGGLGRIAGGHEAVGLTHLWAPLGCGDIGGLNVYSKPEKGKRWRQRYSLPADYFEAIRKEGARGLVVVHGELGPVMTGSLTTHAEMKTANRAAEAALHQAECAWALWSLATRKAVPREARNNLRRAWESVLFNQFHDIVAGVCIAEVHARALHDYIEAIAAALSEREDASERIARMTKSRAGECDVLVFNPLGWRRDGEVEGEVDLLVDPEEAARQRWIAVDEEGRRAPVAVNLKRNAQNKYFRWSARFTARDLPVFGVKRFRIASASGSPVGKKDVFRQKEWKFEVSGLEVQFDEKEGFIRSIEMRDGRRRKRIDGPLAQWVLFEEGKYVPDYNQELRAWYLGLSGRKWTPELAWLKAEAEPNGWLIETSHSTEASEFRQQFRVPDGARRVDVRVRIVWHEVETLARLCFRTDSLGAKPEALRDGPFRISPLPADGREYPMQTLCATHGKGGTLAILNNGRYGCSFDGRDMTISAIRCATWPDPISDGGEYEFEYAILFRGERLDDANLLREGLGFNYRPWMTGCDTLAPGTKVEAGKAGWSPLKIETGGALATALKPLESGKAGAAMRAFNATALEQTVEIAAAGTATAPADVLERRRRQAKRTGLKPFEISTFLIED